MTLTEDVVSSLFSAAQSGDLEGARGALQSGADVNAPNAYGVTPLIEAAGNGQMEMARFLLENGADVDYTGMREGSPLMLVAYMGQDDFVKLFLEHGANVNLSMPGPGETALHMAAVTGKTATVRLLLDAGADPNRTLNCGVSTDMFSGGVKVWGETPLHYAAAYGDEEVIRLLLDAGADPRVENAHGERPLAYAGRHHRPKSVLNLLK